MTAKNHLTIHNVDWRKIPSEWRQQLGLSDDKDKDAKVTVTLDVVKNGAGISKEAISRIRTAILKMKKLPDLDPTFTDADLYDEFGLPK